MILAGIAILYPILSFVLIVWINKSEKNNRTLWENTFKSVMDLTDSFEEERRQRLVLSHEIDLLREKLISCCYCGKDAPASNALPHRSSLDGTPSRIDCSTTRE